MKKVVAILGLAFLMGGSVGAFADSSKLPAIATVNVQEVFQESPRIADLNKKLQDQFKARQEKLLAAQKNLQDEMDAFKKDSETMSKKEKDRMQKKIVSDQTALSKDANAFQQDLSKEQKKMMNDVLSDLRNIISGIAKKNNYSLVLDAQAVVYSPDSKDITKDVAKAFDNE